LHAMEHGNLTSRDPGRKGHRLESLNGKTVQNKTGRFSRVERASEEKSGEGTTTDKKKNRLVSVSLFLKNSQGRKSLKRPA